MSGPEAELPGCLIAQSLHPSGQGQSKLNCGRKYNDCERRNAEESKRPQRLFEQVESDPRDRRCREHLQCTLVDDSFFQTSLNLENLSQEDTPCI